MVETINKDPTVDTINISIENFNVPVIFVENNGAQVTDMSTVDQRTSDHYAPSVRVVYVNKHGDGNNGFGFHLSRSKWDPYPYVSSVDTESSANAANLKEGDVVLEVMQKRLNIIFLLLKATKPYLTVTIAPRLFH